MMQADLECGMLKSDSVASKKIEGRPAPLKAVRAPQRGAGVCSMLTSLPSPFSICLYCTPAPSQ